LQKYRGVIPLARDSLEEKMAERRMGQMSFADNLVADVVEATTPLDRIAGLVDWREIGDLLSGLRSGRMGAPSYPALILFKALLLQQWYGLSDPELEDALKDRLSFRRFLGVSLSERLPDHSSLWRFREQLAASGLTGQTFAMITAQIERAGFVLKRGTLIDASLIRSAVNPPPPPVHLPPDADGRPASKLVRHPADPEAAWTRKQGRHFFGYKAHLAMDLGSRIIRRATLTPANINDSVPADQLICGDEATVWADKAYDSKARRALLRRLGIRDGIARRGNRWHQPNRWSIRRNEVISHYRAPIEPMFSLLKNVHGFARARYRGVLRNATALLLAATVINLKRWVAIASAV
jgi:IS5 family transposase